MFRRILVANRGEIACRVINSARKLGVECVAVFSEADRHAQHVKMADHAVCVGGTASAESYLRADRVLAAAHQTGAQAIHPGYGFLSENAEFADAVREAGLTFIGPPAQSMREMGSKDAAKRLMEAAGVPLLPGYHGTAQDWETLEREARACGLDEGKPVLLKAVLGGGGKGMRIVPTLDELKAAIEGARREALASFGDDRLLIERYLPSARHIEVQVFCDRHGGAVHLFERDCSVQRRHQKVLEEAPAPGVDDALRSQLGEAAVKAARAVGYEGAGTVEFIADAADASQFFFMEMNTRLQVEHPITEMVTGIDLVEWQLRVAAGEPLPLAQDELTLSGHAFEARIYAERPEAGFLPGSGNMDHLRTPRAYGDTYVPAHVRGTAAGHAVRLDTGVVEGDEISVFYDPMIAKLIVRGTDRPSALQLLRGALADWQTVGTPTNVAFLRRVLDTTAFANAEVHTAFIEQHSDDLLPKVPPPPSPNALQLAGLAWLTTKADELAATLPAGSAWGSHPFLRLGGGVCGGAGTALKLQQLGFDGEPAGSPTMLAVRRIEEHVPAGARAAALASYEMTLVAGGDASSASRVSLLGWCADDRTFSATIDGEHVSGSAHLAPAAADAPLEAMGTTINLFAGDGPVSVLVSDVAQQAQQTLSAVGSSAGAVAASVNSPMPGKIVRLLVGAGQAVTEGEPLVVLEAMKMEHTLKAPADVVIAGVHAKEGDVVGQKALLLSFDTPEEKAAAAA